MSHNAEVMQYNGFRAGKNMITDLLLGADSIFTCFSHPCANSALEISPHTVTKPKADVSLVHLMNTLETACCHRRHVRHVKSMQIVKL